VGRNMAPLADFKRSKEGPYIEDLTSGYMRNKCILIVSLINSFLSNFTSHGLTINIKNICLKSNGQSVLVTP